MTRFADRSFIGGPSLNPKVKVATADLTLTFLVFVFEGDSAALTQWQTHWRPILAQAPVTDLAPLVKMALASVSS